MNLFKSLLAAPATLGLFAPMNAMANEVTMSDFNPEEELAIIKSRLDGLEARLNNIEAGSFSNTTTASFSADMAIGAVEGQGTSSTITDGQEAVTAVYGFQIVLNTSFTGEDSLDISIDAGSANSTTLLGELDLNSTSGDDLVVDGVSYTFPIGGRTTVFVGDNVDGSLLYNTACVYGGITNTLDDCGNVESALDGGQGTAAGASFDIGAGFTAAFGYTGAGSTTDGLLTDEGLDAAGAQLTYTADSYGISLTYATKEDAEGDNFDKTYTAVNGYWSPSDTSFPSVSVGFEVMDSETWWKDESSTFFVGLQWDEFGPGTLGAAYGTAGHILDNSPEYYMYEAFYSYPVNDGMTVTPVVYVKETADADETGVIVKTSFSF